MTLEEVPPPEKVRRGAWLIGLLTLLSLVVFFTDEVQQELAEGPTLWIAADQTRALAVGAPVWLAGHRAGRVAGVRLRPPGTAAERRVLIRAVIREDEADRFRSDATATLQPSGALEPTIVSIRPGTRDSPRYDFSDTLEAGPSVTAAQLRAEATRARAALGRLRSAEKNVRDLADTGGGTVARLRRDETLQRRVSRLRERLASAAALLRSDSSDIARLRRNPEAVGDLRSSLGEADSLGARLAEAAGRWRDLGATLASLRERTARLQRLLDESEGSAGRFLHDRALQRELEALRGRILSVQAELLADPFRWLRFQLFRSF